MTVKELIKKLQDMPSYYIVVTPDWAEKESFPPDIEINSVEIDNISKVVRIDW